MRQPKQIFPLFFLALVCALTIATTVRAQTVRWNPPSGQLGYNQVSELTLEFEDCEPKEGLQLPEVAGLVFGRPSQRSETSMVNFSVTRRFSLVFPVRPSQRAPIQIPAFQVETNKGTLRVAAANYTVGDATVGSSGLALNDISSATLTLPKTTFWAGEVFPVSYTLSVIKRYFHSPATLVEWSASPLILEEWTRPEATETMVKGERRIIATQTTRAYAKQPGNFSFKPAQQLVNLAVGTSGFGLFSTPTVEQRVLVTEPVELTIRALPTPPHDFSGMVGQFTLTSNVVPTNPSVGEPITWTLELSGTGNWPDISGLPQREVSSDFSVVQPKSKRTMKDNSLFDGSLTEDVVLVPTKPGRYTLAPVKLIYFDPASGTYKTLTTPATTIDIGTSVAPAPRATSGGPVQFSLTPPSNATATTPTLTLPEAVAPVPPENLPRDPAAETDRRFVPLSVTALVWSCVTLATLLPLLAWLVLAALRSRELDPQRRRREARSALVATLTQLRTADAAARTLLLRAWQQHAAIFWNIPHAAPGTPLVQTHVTSLAPNATGTWTALWAEADRAQHGRDTALPTDWSARAEAALHAVRVPGWSPFSLFAPRHLLPFLFTLVVALAPLTAHANTQAQEAYKRGQYPAAESAWRKALVESPTDWSVRHNLGLALAQQDRWAEATAHWTSGFVLNPRSETARWDLALGLQRSGLAHPELVQFSRGEGRYGLARAASPAEWQLVLGGASLVIAAAFGLLLLATYRRVGAWARSTALSAVLVAIVLAAGATFSLRTYGQLADPSAVLVWRASTLRSVPSEADTQKTTALSAGSLATVDRTFLGWSRLNFASGQTGWARTADLVQLYQ